MGRRPARGLIGVQRLRCLTFNLWKNEGDLSSRLPAIRRVLEEADADVVALQECFVAPDAGIDVASALAAHCGYHRLSYPLRQKVRLHGGVPLSSRSDLALLTRVPVTASGCLPLSTNSLDGERGLIWIDYPVISGEVRIVCTHLTHLPGREGGQLRERQAEELAARLITWTQFGPAILMGDLNARAGADELFPLLDNPLLPPARAPRAWPTAGGWPCLNEGIDHVVLYPGAGPASYHNRWILAPPDPARPEQGASDHPAVLAEIGFA